MFTHMLASSVTSSSSLLLNTVAHHLHLTFRATLPDSHHPLLHYFYLVLRSCLALYHPHFSVSVTYSLLDRLPKLSSSNHVSGSHPQAQLLFLRSLHKPFKRSHFQLGPKTFPTLPHFIFLLPLTSSRPLFQLKVSHLHLPYLPHPSLGGIWFDRQDPEGPCVESTS